MESNRLSVTIHGTADLLQHRYPFPEEAQEQKPIRRSGAKNYDEEWRAYLYRDESGKIYEPASHIEGALLKAAVNFLIPGRRKRSYRELFKSSLLVHPEQITLGKTEPDYIHRALMVVNRAPVWRLRPAFRVWELSFELEVLDDQLEANVIREVLEYAGRFCGLGDSRPRYGRFRIGRFG